MTMGPGGPEVAAFMHLDRGKEWVDHRECGGGKAIVTCNLTSCLAQTRSSSRLARRE